MKGLYPVSAFWRIVVFERVQKVSGSFGRVQEFWRIRNTLHFTAVSQYTLTRSGRSRNTFFAVLQSIRQENDGHSILILMRRSFHAGKRR